MACILGKGVKEDDQSANSLDMKEYFKTKLKSKKLQLDKYDTSNNEDATVVVEEANEQITVISMSDETKTDEHESNVIPPKKKKRESKLINEIDVLPSSPNECEHVVEAKKKSLKVLASEETDDIEQSKKKKSLIIKDTKVDEGIDSGDSDKCNDVKEPVSELVLTHKYQNLVNLLIENSSAGTKYFKGSTNDLLFEEKMKEFTNNVKQQYMTTVGSMETKPTVLNPDNKNFVKDFESQKSKALENVSKRQEVSKYINEKSMFIAKHGDVLFFGSNINDIKGYGD